MSTQLILIVLGLSTPIAAGIAWVFGHLGAYLKAKTALTKATTTQSIALNVAAVLSQVAADAVVQVETQLRPTISEVTADGKLTQNAGIKLKAAAKTIAIEQAKLIFPELLSAVGADKAGAVLDSMIDTQASKLASLSRVNIDTTGDATPPVSGPAAQP